jgi:hypothetical protein
MIRFMKMVASVALTTALTPIAANATVATVSTSLPNVHTVAAQCDAGASHGLRGKTIVQSGRMNQLYPESTGG